MKIRGVKLNFDLYDADNAELKQKYYTELQKMKNVSKDIPSGTEPEQCRYLCGRIKRMFDGVFGEGIGVKVCGKNDNLMVCIEAYEQLVSEQIRQDEKFNKIMERLNGKKMS